MDRIEMKLWRAFFLVLAAVLLPFSMATAILAALICHAAHSLWKLTSRLAAFGGWKK